MDQAKAQGYQGLMNGQDAAHGSTPAGVTFLGRANHVHRISLAEPTSTHGGIEYGLCLCQARLMTLTAQGRTITIIRADNRTDDLYYRALSLGYTSESAARVADCFDVVDLVTDPCPFHPAHSTSIRDGYAVDGCEACQVLILTYDAGYTLEAELARQARLEAEAIECDDDNQATMRTLCGTFALGDAVRHAEMGQGVVCYLGSTGGMEIQFSNGNTIGVGDDHYGEWALIGAAEAEAVECNSDEAPSGIDTLRELITIPTGRTRKPRAPRAVHGADNGMGSSAACGRMVDPGCMTTDPQRVTCKRCPRTRRFTMWTTRLANAAWDADMARAGLRTGLVVRQITTGQLGMITSLAGVIRVSFWAVGHLGGSYSTVGAFDRACEIVLADKFAPVGTRLVSGNGGEAVVREATSGMIAARIDSDGSARVWTLSEFAAEISRGWLAIVPTVKPQPVPTAVYVRPDGQRQSVTTADMAEVGMRVNFGYGAADNGEVVRVRPHAVIVKRADGTQYVWTLAEMVRELNRANVSMFMPDSNGRSIGSWR